MKKFLLGLIIFTISLTLSASIRIVTYNALNFGANDGDRLPYFETILNDIDGDIFLFQEIEDATGGELLLSALNSGTGNFSGTIYLSGPDTNNFLIYRNSLITFASQDTISTDLRDVSEFEMIIDGNLIRLYSCHLRASTGNENERLEEVTVLRNRLNQLPEGSEFIIVGDMNFYTSSEPGYQKFIADETNNIGRAEDFSDQVGNWNNNSNFAGVHTQSTRTTQFGGGASGGLDDRFDFILSSYQLNNATGLEYVDDTLTSFGNDGAHFNQSINDGTNSVVSPEVAEALYYASDHLPVYADFSTLVSTEPMLIVSIPNIEEEWQQGTEHNIEWASASYNGNIKIELLDEVSDEREVLVTSTDNDGEWTWIIPEDESLGEYRIVISDASDNDPTDESNNPFSIIEPTTEYIIYDIQYSVVGPSPLDGLQVITSGIVTAIYDYGYFLQDGSGAWNGIFVYEYGSEVNLGDEVNITATVAEYFDKTELIDIEEYTILSTGNPLPEALLLITSDVNHEAYEGVLVQVESAECISFNSQYNEWIVDDGTGEVMINDLLYAYNPTIGNFYDVTGVVDYSYGLFRIEPRNSGDVNTSSSINEEVVNIGTTLNNYPNPFNPSTTISFSVADETINTSLVIYNLKGQKVKQLVREELSTGQHSVNWDGTDESNQSVSSGIYLYKLNSGDIQQIKKMILMK